MKDIILLTGIGYKELNKLLGEAKAHLEDESKRFLIVSLPDWATVELFRDGKKYDGVEALWLILENYGKQ